jgi:phage terminase small subunit
MAGRPRKTALELLISGTYRKDRHGSRSQEPTAPLGGPPKHLSAEERKVWRETAASAPWLRHPDRPQLEIFCRLLVESRVAFGKMSATRIGLLSRQASKLGLGPTDRSRITPQPGPPERNPFDEFSDPGAKFFDGNAKK